MPPLRLPLDSADGGSPGAVRAAVVPLALLGSRAACAEGGTVSVAEHADELERNAQPEPWCPRCLYNECRCCPRCEGTGKVTLFGIEIDCMICQPRREE